MNLQDLNYGAKITPEPFDFLNPGDGKQYVKVIQGWLDVEDEEYISEATLLIRYPHIDCQHNLIETGSEFCAGGYGHDDNIKTVCRHCGMSFDFAGWEVVKK